ncbi:hypothetical protein [Cupriavidus sp. D384]|uniref:hypothetical protein n=1 Tax=Cupriavidus sp. D384 TaxID=1538095 RepID=UPI0012E84877|nr:hypothetical protein [Cupriavidus sp. D384]
MYQLNKNLKGEVSCVIRISDGAAIPFDEDNRDYSEYLEWIAAGNTPLPAEEAT